MNSTTMHTDNYTSAYAFSRCDIVDWRIDEFPVVAHANIAAYLKEDMTVMDKALILLMTISAMSSTKYMQKCWNVLSQESHQSSSAQCQSDDCKSCSEKGVLSLKCTDDHTSCTGLNIIILKKDYICCIVRKQM